LALTFARYRTPASSRGILDWVNEFQDLDIKFVLRHNSLDAYLFLRFIKTIILICFVGCCLTWPILIPVNATGGGDATQLDRISFSNINDSNRLYAHAVVAWLFLGQSLYTEFNSVLTAPGFIIVLIARERLFLIGLRQAYLLSKPNASRLSSRVVLFLSAPDEAIQENYLSKVFGPDAVRSWPVTNLDKLKELVDDRNQEAMKLEGAQVELCKKANSRRSKNRNASGTSQSVSEEDMPMHRTIPIVSSKVNIIEASRNALLEIVPEIEEHRKSHPPKHHDHSTAIFVEFRTQGIAHRAVQQTQYHNPLKLQPRYVGVLPKEVLWQNLTIGAADRISRGYVATAFIVATILLWSIPIGFVAVISNINYLTDKIHFLRFINNLPSPILGFITGFLPPYIMSEFVSHVPKFFRCK
jgi:calcium permeable stress-gated cation channel